MADTKTRLLGVACRLFHQVGYHATSLAVLADEAEMPRGNVNVYFRHKKDLGKAAADVRMAELDSRLKEIDRLPTPQERLKASLSIFTDQAEDTAIYGDPIIGLSHETDPGSVEVADAHAGIYVSYVAWAEKQFVAMGDYQTSRDRATDWAASVVGSVALVKIFRNPELVHEMAATLGQKLSATAQLAR